MKVDLMPGIKSMSGKSGNMLFKTFKRRDGKVETRAYLLPKNRETGKYGYKRRIAPSDAEIAARTHFKEISLTAKNLPEYIRQAFEDQWMDAKQMFNGKKYATLRGYIIARLYDEDKFLYNYNKGRKTI